MGGCLGPKQRIQQVYIQMIQTIHEEVTQMNFSQNQNLDIYQAIKQKLSKKGLLRKLIDNLISHRNKIYDSLNHNYQIVLQNSKIENKYAGLLIIDQIIQGIYQTAKINKISNDSQDYTNMSNLKSQNMLQKINQIIYNKSVFPSKLTGGIQTNPLIRQIDSRFDLIYFNLITYLLENVPRMYLRILKSINSFCLYKKNKFNCSEAVWEVLNFIMTSIIKGINLKQNSYTYNLLLQNNKQNFKDYQKATDLKVFIKIWMSQRQKISKQDESENYECSAELSQTLETVNTQVLIINAIKIVSLYFNTNISTWNSQYLYEILLDFYDEHEFDIPKIGQFQNAIFQIVLRNDLHVHFFRGLFVELLEYLCYKFNPRTSRIGSELYSNPQEIKWKNMQKKHVKFNAIKSLRRWVNKKHVNPNQTVSYNCNLLVSAYVQNLHPLDDLQNIEISKQFLKLIRQNLSDKSKQILVSTLIQHIKKCGTDSRVRSILVSIMRQLLQDQDVFGHFGQDFDYILTVEEHYSKQNQMQIVQLMGFIVKALPNSFFNQGSDPSSSQIINFKHRICEFLFTCFQVIAFSPADQPFKYRFCCALVSFLRAVGLKGNVSITYAFYLQLLRQLTTPSSGEHVPNKNYFILNLAYEVAHILMDAVKVPADFRVLNVKILSLENIDSNKYVKNKATEINELTQVILAQQKYNQPELIKQAFQSQAIYKQMPNYHSIGKYNFQSTCKILRNYFSNDSCIKLGTKNASTGQSNQEGHNHNLKESGSLIHNGNSFPLSTKNSVNNPFVRRDSVYDESQNDSYYREQDKNLKDVLNIINT